jgi:hypothetical protein
MDPLSTIGNAAAVGAFLGAAFALLLGREQEAPNWAIKGSVYGGTSGIVLAIARV